MTHPESITILGMESLNTDKAAEFIGMGRSSMDKLLAKTRAGRAKVPIRFIQYEKNGPCWFPKPWLEEFVNSVADACGKDS